MSSFCSCILSCCRFEMELVLDSTWALVTIKSVFDMMKFESLDRGTLRSNRGCLRGDEYGGRLGWVCIWIGVI